MGRGLRALLWALPQEQGMRARRAILESLLREGGSLRISRSLARDLGLRRRDLRREIDAMCAAGAPMDWLDRKTLVATRHHLVTLGLSDDEHSTLVFALRRSMEQGRTKRDMIDATLILAEVLRQKRENISGQSIPPEMGRASPPTLPQVPPGALPDRANATLAVKKAMKRQVKLRFLYTSADATRTDRLVWPLTTTFHGSTLVAWCERRRAFRHFRLDRITAPRVTGDPIPESRDALMRAWRSEADAEDA